MLGILIFGILVLSIMGVSASFWDRLFGGGNEGELATQKQAQAYVEISASQLPYKIFYVSKPYSPYSADKVDINTYDVNSGVTIVNFSFLVTDSNGQSSNLPLGDVTNLVNGNFSINLAGEVTRDILTVPNSCFYTGQEGYDAGPGYYYKNYSCSVEVEWYDVPDPQNWVISVEMRNKDTADAWAMNNSQTFQHKRTFHIDIGSSNINWTATPLVPGTTDLVADYAITTYNYGNVPIAPSTSHYLGIRATNLTNITALIGGGSSDIIMAPNFTGNALGSDPSDACTTTGFAESAYSNMEVSVNKGLAGAFQNDTWFCAKTVPNVRSGTYRSSEDWVVENFWS